MGSPARSAGSGFRPQPFGRYTLLRRIGAGGMGEIYLAKLPGAAGVEKLCVVKKVLPHLTEDASFSQRFLDEAKVAVQLTHGNICQVFDVGEVEENLYLAMEYVEGKTIGKVAGRAREKGIALPIPLVLWMGARLCDGLSYAHRKTDQGGKPLGVVHRDISPNNVILSYEGEVKIIDFGAAKSTVKEEKTAPRLVIGNISYMAPEQARKQFVDRRADVYASAVVLYEMLTGRSVPTGGDFVERWRRAANPSFEAPTSHNPRLPRELDAVLLKALSSSPSDRYPDAEGFRDELTRIQVTLDATVSNSTLSRLMRELFTGEEEAERKHVAELLGESARGGGARDDEERGTDPSGGHGSSEETRLKEPADPSPKTTISRPRSLASGSLGGTDLQRTAALETSSLERAARERDGRGRDEPEYPTSPATLALPGRGPAPEDAPTIAAGSVSELSAAAEGTSARQAPGPWAYLVAFVVALLLGLGMLLVFGPSPASRPPVAVEFAPQPIPAPAAGPGPGNAPAPASGPPAKAPGSSATPSATGALPVPAPGGAAPGASAAAAAPAAKRGPGKVDQRLAAAQKLLAELSKSHGKHRLKLQSRYLAEARDRRRKLGKSAETDPKMEEHLGGLELLLDETAKSLAAERR